MVRTWLGTLFEEPTGICQAIPASRGETHYHGKAMQVEPMKPTLKAPGTKRSKL